MRLTVEQNEFYGLIENTLRFTLTNEKGEQVGHGALDNCSVAGENGNYAILSSDPTLTEEPVLMHVKATEAQKLDDSDMKVGNEVGELTKEENAFLAKIIL